MTDLPNGLLHLAGRDARPLWNEYLAEEQKRIDELRASEFEMRHLQETIDE